jgi:hypothetical protein
VIQDVADYIPIIDLGGDYRSVTNDAEKVIQRLSEEYNMGDRGEKFTGFKRGHKGVDL